MVLAMKAGCVLAVDAEGVAQITFDLPGKVNVMNDDFMAVMDEFMPHLEAKREALKGVIIGSAKRTFFAGGDLSLMGRAEESEQAFLYAHFEKLKGFFRRLEKLLVPVVATINGAALGGGMELALACHHRIALCGDDIVLGLPEVEFGILPGAGGVVRLTGLIGLDRALDYLLSGKKVNVETALQDRIVDDLADSEAGLREKALAWIKANQRPLQPWDDPRRAATQEGRSQVELSFDASPNPESPKSLAVRRIVEVARQSTFLDIDSALQLETEALIELMIRPETASLIAAFFRDRQVVRNQTAQIR